MVVEIARELLNLGGDVGEFAKDTAVFLGIVGTMMAGAMVWIIFFSEAGKKAAREIRQPSPVEDHASISQTR